MDHAVGRGQIENFRADRRGFHVQDTEGQLMRAITKVLQPEQIAAVAEFVSQMTRIVPQPTIKTFLPLNLLIFAPQLIRNLFTEASALQELQAPA